MYNISIITINYNNINGLKRTVDSVLNQSYRDIEYIIIDGGSQDGSAEYLKSMNDRFYSLSENDKGIYNAMNKGIKKATGDYILFMNSGDHFYEKESLEKAISYLDGTDIIYFDWEMIGKQKVISNYPERLNFFEFTQSGLPHQSTFIKRELFEIYGEYDETTDIIADWKFFITVIFKHNRTYKKINEIISCYYMDGISSMRDLTPDKRKVIRDIFPNFADDIDIHFKHKKILHYLKKSKRIKILNQLGIINTKQFLTD